MKHAIFATLAVSVLACLGLAQQAKALNQQDLEQFKTTGSCPRCDLSGADLSGANLPRVILRDANLKGANFSQSDLRGADLTGANLEGALLNNANLTAASLTGALMKSASLENANLAFASFMSTNLEATNLKGANTMMTNFRGAYFRLTTMPTSVVTADKPYGWSLQRPQKRECDKFKLDSATGSVCATELRTEDIQEQKK
ncbi:pentapeptide repeat-containing protein [Calothrix sp. UHCC 0171]|uniref:pentapeptide repeat-containing protein n=1 Tax=Calothrix sp. UHCC 0171 TaxID=3110245 RepID=UPI002B20D0ED|nr:pentapeptide repeat-containing protein [Calothrix sp. UHCC 0171]MEA5572817.1 pentapeptide repeat-containing protein [Calothrix sp. UHCC 0171]